MLSSKSVNSSGLAFVSPERRRPSGLGKSSSMLAQEQLRKLLHRRPAALEEETRGAMELHPLATGCVVYVIRQTCHLVAPDERATSEELGDAVPAVFRPTEGVLGVYSSKQQAQFFMDRAAEDVTRKFAMTRGMEPEGVSDEPPPGISEAVWSKLRAASSSSMPPTRVAVVDVELGYKWQYRRWNVIVTVWVERILVDAPPTAALW
ncbi:hypothetical protein DIPPA_09035 [Diplonema papillatum]|nr:hypothetical protein DIPPA_35042 [Diplonema papillatum]KAJ9437690.1 hypothetical protein DIPPA_09035 [Diplonema papillatum]